MFRSILLAIAAVLISPQDKAAQPPLVDAILKKDVDRVRSILKTGSNPNVREILTVKPNASEGIAGGSTTPGRTALDIAVDVQSVPIVGMLLQRKADPNVRSPYGWTPLMTACQRGSVEIVSLLLKHRAKPDLRNVHGDTAIIFAANVDRVDVVDALIRAGANMNGGTGQSALIIAAMCRSEKSIKLLLRRGADPNFHRAGYNTPLEYAISQGDDEIAAMIRRAGGKGRTADQLRKEEEAQSRKWDAQFKSERESRQEKNKAFAKLRLEDVDVLETALIDLATYKGQDFELSWNKNLSKLVLIDETTGNANENTEGQMNSELDERKANDISLEMRRDLMRRNAASVSLLSMAFKDTRILLKPAKTGSDFEELGAKGWISINLPGYSADGQKAVLRFRFGPTPHGASGTYFLVKKNGKWQVRWRDFAHYF